MSELSRQRCFNHSIREAAVRCPSCRQFYCRECVAEHEHRLLCAKCIQSLLQPDQPLRKSLLGPLFTCARLAGAIALLWLIFLLYGQFLLLLPSQFHDAAEFAVHTEGRP